MAKGISKKTAAKTSYKNGSGGGNELFKELWNAAVALRGSIEPSDYKRYVLPLIFLRFLSLRYEKRHAEIVAEIANPKSDLHTKDDQLAFEILNDADNYTSKQTFLVPEEARGENIVKIARADDIKLRLDNLLALLEKTFPKLKGLLPPIYAGSNLDKEGVAGLINLFSKDIFRVETGGVDMQGRVYEYFIGEFANSEGKRGGEYFTPRASSRRWWPCWNRPRARCLIPAAAPAACSCRATPSPTTAASSPFSGRRPRNSPAGSAA